MPSKQIGAKRRGTGKVERNLLTFTGRPGCQEVSQKRGAVGGVVGLHSLFAWSW